MSTPTLTSMPPEVPRDRWGRPLVNPPNGGKPVPYTRCTTYVGVIEDTYNLSRWQQRMVALGLAERRDLALAVAAHRDDKAALNRICEDAQEAAKAHASATTGTALHSLTERVDRGLDLGTVPEEYVPDIEAYQRATVALTPLAIEQFSVQDMLKIGGTPDRVVRYNGKRYIADLKTGSIEWGYLKIAAQLAVYARSTPYDVVTGERLAPHGAELDRGIIVHLPAGTGTCTLYWVDLLAGWEAVKVCRQVREQRALKHRDIVTSFDGTDPDPLPVPSVPVSDGETLVNLPEQIKRCTTVDSVRTLWSLHAAAWTDDLTALAKQHIASLGK